MSQIPQPFHPLDRLASALRAGRERRRPPAIDGDREHGLMSAVAALSRTATEAFTPTDLLRQLVDLATGQLDVDGVGVMVSTGPRLAFVHASQEQVDRVERLQELMQLGPCQEAIRSRCVVAVEDLRELAGRPGWAQFVEAAERVRLRAVVAVPLVSRGRGWGVLDLYRSRPGPWDERQIAVAQLLADVAVSYVVMATDRDDASTAHQELAHRSLHDELTGLPSRALLFDRLEHALCAAARHGQRLAVYFLDVDHFKQVNDRFGHRAGDAVLVEISRRIRAAVREEDTVARLAGDELVLVCERLPQQADGELDAQIAAVGDRIRAALAAPVPVDGRDLTVSVSIGAALSTPTSTAAGLLADADAAMYRAKQQRAGVVVAASAGAGHLPHRGSSSRPVAPPGG